MTDKKQTTPPPQVETPETAASEEELHPAEAIEAAVLEFISNYSQPHMKGQYDQRLISIARTQIELGFLALYKALSLADQAAEGGK